MKFLHNLFPIILYVLLIILVVVLIVLVIRILGTLKKVDQVVDDVNHKVSKLNGLFSAIDGATDTLTIMSNRVVSLITAGIDKLFTKKNKKKEDEEDEYEKKWFGEIFDRWCYWSCARCVICA